MHISESEERLETQLCIGMSLKQSVFQHNAVVVAKYSFHLEQHTANTIYEIRNGFYLEIAQILVSFGVIHAIGVLVNAKVEYLIVLHNRKVER